MIVEDITDRKRLDLELDRERSRLRLLLDLNRNFVPNLELPSFINAVLTGLHERDHWDWAVILLPEDAGSRFRVYMEEGAGRTPLREQSLSINGTIAGSVYRTGEPMIFKSDDLRLVASDESALWLQQIIREKNLVRGCVLPLIENGGVLGVLFLATRTHREFEPSDLLYLQELAQLIAVPLANVLRYGEVTSARDRLASHKSYAEEQIRAALGFENIIGRSKALEAVLQYADTVAPTDSTVLILGETGTGKELIARAVHDRSLRRGQAFIKIDCAAIPDTLLESELFGHERGAFTGAIAQKPGRLEVADKGTLFLDEIGEMPLELQTKLLRVLQDQAFERLGSNKTIQLDVRVIAATHRDLDQMVRQGTFRADLYYRLKVFPIVIPALRDRREDIPALVRHYVLKYAHRMRKTIDVIPVAAMNTFREYSWPGNIRELQHFMERSVILTPGNALKAPLGELEQIIRNPSEQENPPASSRTMEEIERDSILQALRESNWVVGGPNGASAKLAMKRTTLASRMEKLGITRPGTSHKSKPIGRGKKD
jgi:formate hydrogenlyase transcriptional activator